MTRGILGQLPFGSATELLSKMAQMGMETTSSSLGVVSEQIS